MKIAILTLKCFFRLTVLALILTSATLFSQDEIAELPAEFNIVIESSKKNIKLVCLQGCNWKELHYRNTSANILQAVNRYGMIDLTQREVMQSDNVNDFLFTIETSANSIRLKGMVGTAWKELSFDCIDLQCKRVINANGVTRHVQ